MIRWKDADRTLKLSVRDLVERAAPSGHLSLSVVQSLSARAAAGRRVHTEWQTERGEEDEAFQAEARLKVQLEIDEWTCILEGRVDGLSLENDRPVVEEVKSTTLPAHRLYGTTAADFAHWAEQLEIYLWMLARSGHEGPMGRLVLISLVDGARHVLGVPLDEPSIDGRIKHRLAELVAKRERRIAWMGRRRERTVPDPFDSWRPGQREIAEAVQWGIEADRRVLVQAPTGLGKTGAVLVGALKYALKHDKQVFWATQRTTQQKVVEDALRRLKARGLPVRAVTLHAKEKVCLNEVVACRADACSYADSYYDKIRAHRQPDTLADADDHIDRERLLDAARGCGACPFEIGLDLSEQVDVVIGDVNYAFDPSVHLRRHFGDDSQDWIVVVDEAHHLVDRARGWHSPRVDAALAWAAVESLAEDLERFGPYAELAREIAQEIEDVAADAEGRMVRDQVVCEWPADLLARAAQTIDQIGLEYALRRLEAPLPPEEGSDPFQDLCRAVLRFRSALEDAGEESVAIAHAAPGREAVALLCLDPAPHIGPRIERLGGFAGCSATLSPPDFYRDLLGLPGDRLDVVQVPSPFPPENRRILVAPRISTLYRDREAHAPATADFLARAARAVDGNSAVYFPSFAMLDDIVGRWNIPDREILVQRPQMDDAERAAWLERLGDGGSPVVLAAVLGGIFAEGIDLPPGALAAVMVAGPALPPVGLERDLLKQYFDDRYGEGFRYASLIPGITRVVQAAGRLIRRDEDRGVILLVGRRFRWRDIASLLPADWDPQAPMDPIAEIRAFQAGGVLKERPA